MKKQTILLMLAGLAVLLWSVIIITIILNNEEIAKYKPTATEQRDTVIKIDNDTTVVLECDCISFFTACGYSPARCKFLRDSIHSSKFEK